MATCQIRGWRCGCEIDPMAKQGGPLKPTPLPCLQVVCAQRSQFIYQGCSRPRGQGAKKDSFIV
jgi:hypothetical protein